MEPQDYESLEAVVTAPVSWQRQRQRQRHLEHL